MANVLIIDDDPHICNILALSLEKMKHSAVKAQTLKEGLSELKAGMFDVVLLDVGLPDGDGLEELPKIKEMSSSPEVIIITGGGSPDGAEVAIRNGAWDYLQKPLTQKGISLTLNRVLQYRESIKQIQQPMVALKTRGVIGSSRQIRACLDSVAQAANSNASVLVTGETGTGKEVFAKAIHHNSKCANDNFVVVDCATLPDTLVESTLFGYQKGAFTGAEHSVDGLIKQADGGTLFLDEIGELSMLMQKSFLRVLQEQKFRPVGGKNEINSRFRLIAATNKDLDLLADKGLFRKDLLFRIRSISLDLPPLRQHSDDIKELAVYHMTNICERFNTETKGFSSDFFDALTAYKWPGNVRELVKALESAISEALHEPILFPKHLPDRIRIHVLRTSFDTKKPEQSIEVAEDGVDISQAHGLPNYKEFKEAVIAEAEQKYFQNLMAMTKGSVKEATKISGLGRTRLYMLMKKNRVSRLGWS